MTDYGSIRRTLGRAALIDFLNANPPALGIGEVSVRSPAYGATGLGVADETTAFQAAMDAAASTPSQKVVVPGGTYRLDTALTVPDNLHLVLAPDAVLQPRSAAQMLVRAAQAASVSATVSSGATLGSRAVVVASTTGLAADQVVRFRSSSGARPYNWNTIKTIVGTTVTLARPLSITYSGTVTMDVQPLYGRVTVSGGTVDLSQITGASAGVISLAGYASAVVRGVRFAGPNASLTVQALVNLTDNRVGLIEDCEAQDVTCYACAFAVIGSKTAHIDRCVVDGDLFGTLTSSSDFAAHRGITYTGRRSQGASNYSVRAVKSTNDRHTLIAGVQADECETIVECYDVGRLRVSDIQGVNIGLTTYVGQTAITVASSTGNGELHTVSISGLNLENLGGNAVQVSGDATGRIVISDFNIRNCVSAAFQLNAYDLVVGRGTIENWDTGAHSSALGAAVISSVTAALGSVDLSHITFIHTDPTKRCLSLKRGPLYSLVGIIPATGNPLYDTTDGIDCGPANRFTGAVGGVTQSASVAQVGHVGTQPVGFSVTTGQTFTFTGDAFGKLFAVTLGGGQAGLFFADALAANVVIVSDPSGVFQASAAPGAGKVGVHRTGNYQINVTSNFGSTLNVRLCVLGSAATATTDPA